MPGDPATALVARCKRQDVARGARARCATRSASSDGSIAHAVRHLPGATSRAAIWACRSPTSRSPVGEVIGTGLGWTLALGRRRPRHQLRVGTLARRRRRLAARRRGSTRRCRRARRSSARSRTSGWPCSCCSSSASRLRWFPLQHAYSLDREPAWSALCFVADVVRHAVLPALTLVLATLGGWMLSMRNAMVARARRRLHQARDGQGAAAAADHAGPTPRATRCCPASPASAWRSASSLARLAAHRDRLLLPGARLPARAGGAQPGLRRSCRGSFSSITLSVLAANFLVDLLYVWLDPRTRA